MISADKIEFAQLLLTTANQYNDVFSQSFLEIYWYCLKDYSLAEIKAAFLNYFKKTDDKRFMPQPSDILRILTGDNPAQTALAAWTKVHQAIRFVGSYQSIVFDDFIIHAVIQAMGGWITLCQKTEKELTFADPEFQKRYIRYLHHRPWQYSSHLIGLLEHQNQIHQQPTPEPLLFGHPQAALMTYLKGVKPDELLNYHDTSLQFARSAHQLVTDAVKNITQGNAKTERAPEPFSQPTPSPSKRSPHESE